MDLHQNIMKTTIRYFNLLMILSCALGSGKSDQPNVLFIVADDLGWNDVSWHNPNIHSPNIERLASEGVLLDNYYVMPTCTPSRVALMTGKYPYRIGRHHMYIKPLMPVGLPVNVNIMPQYFKEAGYTTHAIGKWHLGYCHQNYTPTYRGFDTFYGFYLGSQDYYTHTKIEKQSLGYDFRMNEKILKGRDVEGKYSTDLFVSRAQSIIDFNKDKDRPWFTYLSFQSVHDPIQVPRSYTRTICRYNDMPRYFYSAMVSALDDAVQQVVDKLKETGQYDNTIIVFTTDNGGAVGAGGNNFPLRGTKGTLFEGGTKAIGFVHSPLLKQKGVVRRNLMHAVDWLPTLMNAIGKPNLATSATDGIDQWNTINIGASDIRSEMVYNIKEKPFMGALRYNNYKIIWGSRTKKDTWYPPNEEVQPAYVPECEEIKKKRSLTDLGKQRSSLIPRGVETAESFKLDIDVDEEYADQLIELEEEQQDVDFEDPEELDDVEVITEDDEADVDEYTSAGLEDLDETTYLPSNSSREARGRWFRRFKRRHKTRQLDFMIEDMIEAQMQYDYENDDDLSADLRGRRGNGSNKKKRKGGSRGKKKNKNKKNESKGGGGGGGSKKGGNGSGAGGGGGGKKKKNKGNFKFRFHNDNGVFVKPYGDAMLFDLSADPEERHDLSAENPDLVDELKARMIDHFKNLIPRNAPPDDKAGDPKQWGGIYSPGWCAPIYV